MITHADLVEIADLVARYDLAADDGDADGWAATWTDDGVWDGGFLVVEGRAALRDFLARLHVDEEFAAFRGGHHVGGNFEVEETAPGEGRLRHDNLMLFPKAEGGVRLMTTAEYDDTVRRVDGRWRFARRVWRPVAEGGGAGAGAGAGA